MIAHRKRTCPFRLDGRGFVKLAREWPRGKVANKARIPVDPLPLPVSPRLARFSQDWFSWTVCGVVRFAVAIRSPLPLPPHGGGLTQGTSPRPRWRSPRFQARLWKPSWSTQSLRPCGNTDSQAASTAEPRVCQRIRPFRTWRQRHLPARFRTPRQRRRLLRSPEPWPKKSIHPLGATNFRLASTDIANAARYGRRATHRCACGLMPTILSPASRRPPPHRQRPSWRR